MERISASLRNLDEPDWRVLQTIRENHNITWREFVHQLAMYPALVEQALGLPDTTDSMMEINVGTVHNLLPMWMDNLRDNFDVIKTGKDIRDIPTTDSRALIIGAGPSLYRNNHLEMLSESEFDGVIFAADRALKDCLDHDIRPNYITILDGSEKILDYIDHDVVDAYSDLIGAIMCITTHPSVVDRWNGERFWFSNSIESGIVPNVSYLLHLLLKKTELFTSGHATSVGWSVAHTIGCRELGLIGLDLSYPTDMPKEETWYYDRYKTAFGDDVEKIESMYKPYHHTFFGTDCYYDPVFENYLKCTLMQLAAADADGCKIFNCTEGGAVEGSGVTCMRFEDWVKS